MMILLSFCKEGFTLAVMIYKTLVSFSNTPSLWIKGGMID